jgi:hypothetical protein
MLTLLGNSGTATGNNGFQLGQANNVTATVVTSDTVNTPATAGFSVATNVTACVVAITGMGMNPGGQGGYNAPPTITGLTPTATRTNVDGTTLAVNGGTSAISNVSSVALTNTSTGKWVQLSTTAIAGAVGYAWYVGTGTTAVTSAGQCTLAVITPYPKAIIGAQPAGGQLGNATGLSTDYSSQTTDFDGLLTYAFQKGYWNDMGGGSFTSIGNGQVQQLETDLQYLWTNFQAQPDAIWCSADVRAELDSAILYSTTGTNSYIFPYDKTGQSGIMGGFMVSAYKSKYSINPEGGAAIPIRLHPMMPAGTLFYDINTNPYPHSRIPAVREFFTQRDYYAIEWPIITREWTYGTYIHEVLAHYLPWVSAVRTGIGPFVAPCWIAAAVYDEDYATGPTVNIVRNWLMSWEQRSGLGKIVVGMYRLHGQVVAEMTKKSSLLKKGFKKLFDVVLKKAVTA